MDVGAMSDAELTHHVMRMQELRGALDEAEARVLDRWNQKGVWQPDGAKSAAAWLASRQHLQIGVARQRLRHARAVRRYPAIADAWAAGAIDRTHVTTLLASCTPRTRGGVRGRAHGAAPLSADAFLHRLQAALRHVVH